MKKTLQEETVLVELSEEDRAQRAFELVELTDKIRVLKEQKSAAMAAFNEEIKVLEGKALRLTDACITGQERQTAQTDMFLKVAGSS